MQVKLATLALISGSGWAMFAWLRALTTPTRALIGALAYLVAPYHLDDHYLRGAFAELAAFVAIPVLALGMEQTGRAVRSGPLLLAAGWAALIFAHLPIAMLTGALLVPTLGLYALWRSERRLAFALTAGAALAVGTALAAIYLVPALQLQDAISADYWWSARFQAADRLLTNPAAWSLPLEPFFGAISFAEAALAAWIGAGWPGEPAIARLGFWAGVTILVFAAVTGLLPGFWSLPLLAKAQFPWRAMTVQDFAFVTLIALAPRNAMPIAPAVFVALALGNAAALVRDLAAGPAAARTLAGYGATSFPTDADAPEYLPRGMLRIGPDGPAPAAPLAGLQAAPLAAGASAARAGQGGDVELTPAPGARIVLRRFYFPAWQVACDGRPVAAAPFGPGRLVAFVPPQGARQCRAWAGETPPEALGAAIAGAGLAVFALYAAWLIAAGLRRRRPRLDRDRPAPI